MDGDRLWVLVTFNKLNLDVGMAGQLGESPLARVLSKESSMHRPIFFWPFLRPTPFFFCRFKAGAGMGTSWEVSHSIRISISVVEVREASY
jgi:hypothetical protein